MQTVILFTLLMMGGLGGAAASDLQVYGKSIYRDKNLLSSNSSRHTVRKQPHQQTKNEIRSLDLESFNIDVTPTASKISLPTIVKLYPPTAMPPHLHNNMPLRFGRESDPDNDSGSNSMPNMPQRFGRSWRLTRMCAVCPALREAANPVLPQRFGRNNPFWSLPGTLASEQLLNTGLHWAKEFDFTTSSEEQVEIVKKAFD